MTDVCARCLELASDEKNLVKNPTTNNEWVCNSCLSATEKIEMAGLGHELSQVMRERASGNRLLTFLIAVAVHRKFMRIARTLAYFFHYFYGHYAFKRIAPLLGLDVIPVSPEQRGNSPFDFAIVGKLSSPESSFRYELGRKKGHRISLVSADCDANGVVRTEIFEMPLPHVKKDINDPEEHNGRGATKSIGAFKYRSLG